MSNKASTSALIAIVVIALAALAAWFWYQGQAPLQPPPTADKADGASAQAPVLPIATPAAAPPSASEPQVQFPVEQAETQASEVDAGFDFGKALAGLLGSKAAGEFLQTSDFPRRFVATVDNLGRSQAPASLWPVNPTPGKFQVDKRDDGSTVISAAANSQRYTPLVRMLDAIDIAQAIGLYVKIYPLLQKAYEDIGYPNRYFNDRFVEVVDKLLATPEVLGPIQLQLTEVKGPLPSTRPWVRYEFVDPGLEQLSAGQKIMLRVGADNRRRLKARLTELRQALTRSVRKN